MNGIRNYTDTLIEFKIAKARLDYLLLKREELEVRYCGAKAISYQSIGEANEPSMKDNMMEFIIAITTPDENTGLSLDEEIEEKSCEVLKLYDTLSLMTKALSQLKDIEGQLYYKIVVEGQKVSNAIKQVSEEKFMSEQNIYARYYPNIKEDITRLKL